jgi:hypothetical protein
VIKAFKQVGGVQPDLDKVQKNLGETFGSILNSLVLDGVLLSNISLITGQVNVVDHKLGRVPQGWIIAGQNANTVIWSSPAALPSKSLELNCGANVTINLWVF